MFEIKVLNSKHNSLEKLRSLGPLWLACSRQRTTAANETEHARTTARFRHDFFQTYLELSIVTI